VSSAPAVILVIDDEKALSSLLQNVLEREGYRVETAADGASGLARLDAGGVDLVLLDIMLPDIDGRDLCRRIRARESRTYLPVIMLTALVTPTDSHAGFSAGADDYLTKPFQLQDLLDRVQVWLRVRDYLEAEARQRADGAGEDDMLQLALTTSHDLTRLLMLLLSALEAWEPGKQSSQDLESLRAEFQSAASVLASRINLLTAQARSAAR
jgi:DNA-binding response OmpR family regulator